MDAVCLRSCYGPRWWQPTDVHGLLPWHSLVMEPCMESEGTWSSGGDGCHSDVNKKGGRWCSTLARRKQSQVKSGGRGQQGHRGCYAPWTRCNAAWHRQLCACCWQSGHACTIVTLALGRWSWPCRWQICCVHATVTGYNAGDSDAARTSRSSIGHSVHDRVNCFCQVIHGCCWGKWHVHERIRKEESTLSVQYPIDITL
jgi:hypothetical protein